MASSIIPCSSTIFPYFSKLSKAFPSDSLWCWSVCRPWCYDVKRLAVCKFTFRIFPTFAPWRFLNSKSPSILSMGGHDFEAGDIMTAQPAVRFSLQVIVAQFTWRSGTAQVDSFRTQRQRERDIIYIYIEYIYIYKYNIYIIYIYINSLYTYNICI